MDFTNILQLTKGENAENEIMKKLFHSPNFLSFFENFFSNFIANYVVFSFVAFVICTKIASLEMTIACKFKTLLQCNVNLQFST